MRLLEKQQCKTPAARTGARSVFALATLLLSLTVAPAGTTLYLGSDDFPVATLKAERPATAILANHDPGRDDFPGLVLQRGGSGVYETDPAMYQQWVGSSEGVSLSGAVALEFWAAIRDFGVDRRGVVQAFLLECDPSGSDCSQIASGGREIGNWSGGFGSWTRNSVEFGNISHTVPAGRSLSIKITVSADSDDDMWFAYDSSLHPARLTDTAASDTVIDGNFAEWFDTHGTEFIVFDQGGNDDFGSPTKLDITGFGVSSNLVDSFNILISFDELAPKDATAATLIDIDLDNNVDFALVATLDETASYVELYSCDDTITYGCNNAVLEEEIPSSLFKTGTANGPWNGDSFLEVNLPFNDLGEPGRVIVFTSLVSYASAAFLTSPKDSVLGEGFQDYENGIQYDRVTGTGRLIGAIGSEFIIRRHTDPSQVRTSGDHAVTYTAPYDDLTGSLVDGQTYYYVVEKTGGLSVSLSAHANLSDNSVRLGFDDQDALSAPVDGYMSTVSVDTTAVPADGTTSVTVTVAPHDANGTPIGSGCSIDVDEFLLAPGVLARPIVDNFDGTFSFRVVSTSTGSGTVAVSAEGVDLADQVQVTFE